jgi:hypothetical protein
MELNSYIVGWLVGWRQLYHCNNESAFHYTQLNSADL